MTAVIGRGFVIINGRCEKLTKSQFYKRFVPPRKLNWQERLLIHYEKKSAGVSHVEQLKVRPRKNGSRVKDSPIATDASESAKETH